MKCPYCNTAIYLEWEGDIIEDRENRYEGYGINYEFCPNCGKLIIELQHGRVYSNENGYLELKCIDHEQMIYPIFPNGRILSEHIPEKYVKLYRESEEVNLISPRASATLSRYTLQMILHEEMHISKRNLEDELKELESKSNVPSSLITMLQVMRRVANFGAHPKKSTNSNEIVEVENGESDVMLELLVELFDYIFVKPRQQEEFLKKVEEKYGIKA